MFEIADTYVCTSGSEETMSDFIRKFVLQKQYSNTNFMDTFLCIKVQ